MANLTVYSTSTCPYCIRLKNYLNQQGIPFVNVDVAADPKALEKMVSLSGQMGVPVIDIDGKITVGFEKDKIDKLLNLPH